jgi:L,D-transpeptidase YcbB
MEKQTKNLNMNGRWVIFSLLIIGIPRLAVAQVNSGALKQYIQTEDLAISCGIKHEKEVREYYSITDYNLSWIGEKNDYNRQILLDLIKDAGQQGLNRQDYHPEFIGKFSGNPAILRTARDSIIAEIKFSDAAIHFFNDFMQGNVSPALRYDGLHYIPSCNNVPKLLAQCTINNQLCLLEKWEPPFQEIKLLRERIQLIYDRQFMKTGREEKIISSEVNHLNKPLLSKIYQLGISDFNAQTSDSVIKEMVKEAQRQFNLLPDGVLHSTILTQLNVPVTIRLQELSLAINYYRWLSCLARQQRIVVVNIPATVLKVYYNTSSLLEMKMIVGKPSTPTPALSSLVSEVILYPYWMVPHSIATKELLPAIKKNPGYIDANNYQVINSQGKIVNPYSINWTELSTANFPYVIRQSTGCDNALGLIKLNFYNPFGVYLHDTPTKLLFKQRKRFYSHGCMRMEKPMDLGHLILKNNSIAIDTLTEKGCIKKQSPVVVPAEEKMPVVVWYNPVGTDSSGRIIWYEDIYRKFNWKNSTN